MKHLLTLAAIVFTLFITACNPNAKPNWTLNPPQDGNVYGVGSCPIHVSGVNHQRALAISMAIDEIARQNGVTVNNTFESMRRVSGGASSSASQSYSVQSVNGQTVKAKIVEVWQEKRSKKIFVLMVQE